MTTTYRELFITGVFLTAIALGACGDDDVVDEEDMTGMDVGGDIGPSSDAGVDMPADMGTPCLDPTVCRTPVQEGVSPDGHDDVTEALGAGESRVGRLSSSDTGFEGIWADCREGDFKLYNSEVVFCVQDEDTNRFEAFSGGVLVDAAPVGYSGDDVFDVFKPRAELNIQFVESVEVVSDGSDGGAAVIRMTGFDMPIGYFVGVVGPNFFQRIPVQMTTEYRLEPDADHLEIVTWHTNGEPYPVGFQSGDWIGFGDRSTPFRPGTGADLDRLAQFRWVGARADGISFGWVKPGDPAVNFQVPFDDIPWVIADAGIISLQPGEEGVFRRWLLVGDGSLDGIRRRALEMLEDDEDRPLRTITVVDENGDGVAGREVVVSDADGPVTTDVTDDAGDVEFALSDGTYDVKISAPRGAPATEASVDFATSDTAQVTVPTPGTLSVDVADATTGDPLSARITITGDGNAEFVALRGSGEVELLPGDYHVVASRGVEYDFAASDVTITAGQTTSATLDLLHSVDTNGWIGADFHQHMEPSPDSSVHVEDRVLDNIGEGVEFLASTDHDIVTDLRPVITEMGVDDLVDTWVGVEISPAFTHIGIYPMPYRGDERGHGTVPLGILKNGEPANRTIPEVIAIARELETNPLVQVNHGRRGSGLFDRVGFDPTTDPADITDDEFTLDFDTMEVINRFSNTCILFHDWSGFLNAGYPKTALGNSDTHGIWGESGHPRNFLRIGSQPGEVSGDDVRNALLGQQVTVSANAFIDFGDGRLPGETITATTGADVDFHIRVQTPNWSDVTKLIVVVNGAAVSEIDVSGGTPPLDFNDVVTRSFSEDSWIVFYAWGPQPSGEVRFGDPVIAFTNPLYVDVDGDADGDGEMWEPPGPGPLDLGALNQGDYCSD